MFKAKMIYIYQTEALLNESITLRKPMAEILQTMETDGSEEKAFEFLTAFRKPVKQFAHRVLKFDDSKGLKYHEMWYSPIDLRLEHVHVTNHLHDVQDAAKMSVVAIPLCYILGADNTHASKYCVITNWWKVRVNNGDCTLPGLTQVCIATMTLCNLNLNRNPKLKFVMARSTCKSNVIK
jgi:hypothetical protein